MLPRVRTLVIFNPISGAGRASRRAAVLAGVLEKAGQMPHVIESEPSPAENWLAGHLASSDAGVVVGGDGLVHAVAPVFAASGVPLLHDPAGTENLFARDLYKSPRPKPPEVVAEWLSKRAIRRVDLIRLQTTDPEGVVTPSFMLVMASIGFDAAVVEDLAARRAGAISKWSYTAPILRAIGRWRGSKLTVSIDGEAVCEGEQGSLIIANSHEYAGRLDPARAARIDDGLLDVVFMPARTAVGMAKWSLLAMARGAHVGRRGLRYRTGSSLSVLVEPASDWQVDGDPGPSGGPITHLEARVDPMALPVIVPS
jgi:diacylglycerol kinase (ATP)